MSYHGRGTRHVVCERASEWARLAASRGAVEYDSNTKRTATATTPQASSTRERLRSSVRCLLRRLTASKSIGMPRPRSAWSGPHCIAVMAMISTLQQEIQEKCHHLLVLRVLQSEDELPCDAILIFRRFSMATCFKAPVWSGSRTDCWVKGLRLGAKSRGTRPAGAVDECE